MQIEKLIDNTLNNLKQVIDSNNIIGKPIVNGDLVVIPISRITFGFVTGGGEYGAIYEDSNADLPYANASGAGVNVNPIGFLISNKYEIKYVNADKVDGDNKWANLLDASMQILKDMKK